VWEGGGARPNSRICGGVWETLEAKCGCGRGSVGPGVETLEICASVPRGLLEIALSRMV
jgi:hypothetical protein